ncbi:MAG: signal peptide peptidase SppA [Prevotellaceae bacterium]|jgi:protease-4|nr:signal peptide peptidase SppA [Prevotellaceae bacterium]
MKNFLKMLLASVLGVFIVFMIVFFMLLLSVNFSEPVIVKNNSILKISLDKPLVDRAGMPSINLSSLSIESNMGLNHILFGIERAKYDPRIKGIYLELSSIDAGIASVEEIRNALTSFKQSGKYVLAYAEYYSQKAYYLATIADKIYLNPFGSVDFRGISSEITFFKGLLDKLGIDVQIIRHGKFKSAIEPLILNSASEESKAQIMEYMGSIWNFILQTISEARDINPEDLNKTADNIELTFAEDAMNKNFVDKLLYEDEVLAELRKYSGGTALNTVDISKYYVRPVSTDTKSDKIALVYASGEIISGEGETDIMSKNMVSVIRAARNDSTVKAVVFRVNSPGGSAAASEIIARELELTKQTKPVVISMGDLAASGGYWISAPSHKIFAHHTTITGSIGVFMMLPDFGKAAKDKLGITFDVVKTNEHADFPSVTRPLKPAEKDYLQKSVEYVYSKFIDKVATFRNISAEKADSIGQGRVWSGVNALDIGLIDYFGGIAEAVEEAARLADISDYTLLELPRELSTFEMILKSIETKVSGSANSELSATLKHYEYLMSSLKNYGMMAKLPYEITIE